MGLTIPPVVDLEWVREHRDGLVFADVRWYLDGRSGYDAYRAGHLPGAIWVDVDTDLSAPSTFEEAGIHCSRLPSSPPRSANSASRRPTQSSPTTTTVVLTRPAWYGCYGAWARTRHCSTVVSPDGRTRWRPTR